MKTDFVKRRHKAQMEAPIELFVAVIVLTLSLALAFMVMGRTDEGKCIAALKTETEKLQSAMLDVAFASPPTSRVVTFTMPRCGSINVEALQFVYYSRPEFCGLCPGHYGGCWQIIPVSVDKDGNYVPVADAVSCVNMAGDIWIEQEEGCAELSREPCPSLEAGKTCKANVPRTWTDARGTHPFYSTEKFAEDVISRWETFGKQGTEKTYVIKLTKAVTQAGGQNPREVGQINVCIMTPKKWETRQQAGG